jgi:hypothetical protein
MKICLDPRVEDPGHLVIVDFLEDLGKRVFRQRALENIVGHGSP